MGDAAHRGCATLERLAVDAVDAGWTADVAASARPGPERHRRRGRRPGPRRVAARRTSGCAVERLEPPARRRRAPTRTGPATRCRATGCRSCSGGSGGPAAGGSCSSAMSTSSRSATSRPGRATRGRASVDGDRLYGRGAVDMKGGVASILGARAGARRRRPRGPARGRDPRRDRALGGGRRAGHARRDPRRRDRRHGRHHRADRPRRRHRPCRRDHVQAHGPGPRRACIGAPRGHLRARQPADARPRARGGRDRRATPPRPTR